MRILKSFLVFLFLVISSFGYYNVSDGIEMGEVPFGTTIFTAEYIEEEGNNFDSITLGNETITDWSEIQTSVDTNAIQENIIQQIENTKNYVSYTNEDGTASFIIDAENISFENFPITFIDSLYVQDGISLGGTEITNWGNLTNGINSKLASFGLYTNRMSIEGNNYLGIPYLHSTEFQLGEENTITSWADLATIFDAFYTSTNWVTNYVESLNIGTSYLPLIGGTITGNLVVTEGIIDGESINGNSITGKLIYASRFVPDFDSSIINPDQGNGLYMVYDSGDKNIFLNDNEGKLFLRSGNNASVVLDGSNAGQIGMYGKVFFANSITLGGEEIFNWNEFRTNFVKKTGDTMTGVLTTRGILAGRHLNPTAGVIGNGSIGNGMFVNPSGIGSYSGGLNTTASEDFSFAGGKYARATNNCSFVWNGNGSQSSYYGSHGIGTFNINPTNGLEGFYIGNTNILTYMTRIFEDSYLEKISDSSDNKTAITIGERDNSYSVGQYSVVHGNNNAASESYSFAQGKYAYSTNEYAFVWNGMDIGKTSITVTNNQSVKLSNYGELPTYLTIGQFFGTNLFWYNLDKIIIDNNTFLSYAWNTPLTWTEVKVVGNVTNTTDITSRRIDYYPTLINENVNFVLWEEDDTLTFDIPVYEYYGSHGPNTFNINPEAGLGGFYIGKENLAQIFSNYVKNNNYGDVTINGVLHPWGVDSVKICNGFLPVPGTIYDSVGENSLMSGYSSLVPSKNSVALGISARGTNDGSFVWSGVMTGGFYNSHGDGTFNLNPTNGLDGIYIGEKNLAVHMMESARQTKIVQDQTYQAVPGDYLIWSDMDVYTNGPQTIILPDFGEQDIEFSTIVVRRVGTNEILTTTVTAFGSSSTNLTENGQTVTADWIGEKSKWYFR